MRPQPSSAIAAPLAGLFLILTAVVMNLRPPAVGFPVLVVKRIVDESHCADDRRTVVVDVADEHWVRVNQDALHTLELEPRLHEIYQSRAVAVLCIKGSGDLPFGRIAVVIDIASRQVDYVAIVTPADERQEGGCSWIHYPPDSSSLRTQF